MPDAKLCDMLQINNALSTVDVADAGQPESASPAELILSILGIIRRQWVVIGVASLLIISLGVIYIYVTPPSFTAEASLMLDRGRVQLFAQQPIIGESPVDSLAVESQVQVVKSDNIARAVISNLRLTEDPEFTGVPRIQVSPPAEGITIFESIQRRTWRSVVSAIAASGQADAGLMGLEGVPGPDESIRLLEAPLTDAMHELQTATPDQDIPVLSGAELERRALDAFAARLNVMRVGPSFVLAISFRAKTAERAAQIANACLLYTSPSPRDRTRSRMPSSA